MADQQTGDDGHTATGKASTRIIKKYANRRLYDTEQSRYVTLDDLRAMVREGGDFQVLDARTNDDLTHQVLTQIIMEAEQGTDPMLPADVLRQMIAMYGGSMQAMVPHYLRASLESMRANQRHFRDTVEGAVAGTPFEQVARANLAMFDAATAAFRGGGVPPVPHPDPRDAEIERLRRELDALRRDG